jgi:uncharacterized membrane protein
VELDIESDPSLLKTFLAEIPVLEIGPYLLKAPISRQSLEMTLGAALDRRTQLEQVGDMAYQKRLDKGRLITTLDRFTFWLARHYLLVLNLIIFTYVGLPVLAPVLMKTGFILPSRIIHKIYSPLCHQFGFRSFFLFGEQFYYPLDEAKMPGVITFEEATGITGVSNPTSSSRIQARQFVGNENLGYKMALCERDIAIYSGLLLFGIVYVITGRKFGSLHWSIWILIGLGPIGLDGFSQLFSQFEWSWLAQLLPYRESTPLLRVLTGGIFGFFTAWFAYPNIEESMDDTRKIYLKRFAVADNMD